MAHKFRVRDSVVPGQFYEYNSDISDSIYICDICKVETSYEEFWEKGGKFTLQRGQVGQQYAMHLELCPICSKNIEECIDTKIDRFHIHFSEEDKKYVCKCYRYPSLSYMDEDPAEALCGMMKLVKEVKEKVVKTLHGIKNMMEGMNK